MHSTEESSMKTEHMNELTDSFISWSRMQWNLNNAINTQFIINQRRAAQFSRTKIIEFHRQAYKCNGMKKINFPLIIISNKREKCIFQSMTKSYFVLSFFLYKVMMLDKMQRFLPPRKLQSCFHKDKNAHHHRFISLNRKFADILLSHRVYKFFESVQCFDLPINWMLF